jgi:hypothetical protein
MTSLYHQETLVHLGVSSGRGAAARRDKRDGLPGRELATAGRLWRSDWLRRSDCPLERRLDNNGRADRLDIECCGLLSGYVAARGAGAGHSGLRPLQFHGRGDLQLRWRGGQREITPKGYSGLFISLFTASRSTRRDYNRQGEQKTSTHDFSAVLENYVGRSELTTSCFSPKTSTVHYQPYRFGTGSCSEYLRPARERHTIPLAIESAHCGS